MAAQVVAAAVDLLSGSRCVGCERPGPVLCPSCREVVRARPRPCAWNPLPESLAASGAVVWAGAEYAGLWSGLIVAYKERGRAGLAAPLGQVLAEVVAAAVSGAGSAGLELVPVPSTRASRRRRGRDPVASLAAVAAQQLRSHGAACRVAHRLSHRRSVRDQAGLTAAERSRNLRGALTVPAAVSARGQPPPRVRVVVDDVLTTGATVDEAVRALVTAGWPVAAVAAVAATPRRSAGTDRRDAAVRLSREGLGG